MVEGIVKEVQSIENSQRNKNQQYAQVKGQLTQALRKKTYVRASPQLARQVLIVL